MDDGIHQPWLGQNLGTDVGQATWMHKAHSNIDHEYSATCDQLPLCSPNFRSPEYLRNFQLFNVAPLLAAATQATIALVLVIRTSPEAIIHIDENIGNERQPLQRRDCETQYANMFRPASRMNIVSICSSTTIAKAFQQRVRRALR